jgi:hypothetical protein
MLSRPAEFARMIREFHSELGRRKASQRAV